MIDYDVTYSKKASQTTLTFFVKKNDSFIKGLALSLVGIFQLIIFLSTEIKKKPR